MRPSDPGLYARLNLPAAERFAMVFGDAAQWARDNPNQPWTLGVDAGRELNNLVAMIDPIHAGAFTPPWYGSCPPMTSSMSAVADANPGWTSKLRQVGDDIIARNTLRPEQVDVLTAVSITAQRVHAQLRSIVEGRDGLQ